MKLLYEGKAKKIYESDKNDEVIIHYKDDATAYNGVKKAQITDKGILNNKISSLIYAYLGSHGIKNHFIEQISDNEQRCKKVSIIPLEVVVRNVTAGSICKRLQLKEGVQLKAPVYELCYKNDDLGDPLINDHHAVMLNLATFDELKEIHTLTMTINELLITYFNKMDISLVDFKLEFGKDTKGNIILADEISPDSCRLWDKLTMERLDKDRFRRDLGNIKEAYQEIYDRILKNHG